MDYDSVILRDERKALAGDKNAVARIINYERRLRKAIEKFIKGGTDPLELIDLEDATAYEEGFDSSYGE